MKTELDKIAQLKMIKTCVNDGMKSRMPKLGTCGSVRGERRKAFRLLGPIHLIKKLASGYFEASVKIKEGELGQASPIHLRLSDARKILTLIVHEHTAITQREVADRLELSTVAVSKQTNSAIGDGAIRVQVKIGVSSRNGKNSTL